MSVAAANELTARWCATFGPDESFVVSGAGVWPLLALLASVSDGAARAELETAVGRPAATARDDALDLLRVLDAGNGVAAALGLWVREDIPLDPSVPSMLVGPLRDQQALDAWAQRVTGGLIERMPVTIDASVLLVLATALVARTKWVRPFSGGGDLLRRLSTDLTEVTVLEGDVTRVVVAGANDLDVHLVIGEDALAAAFSGRGVVRTGADLEIGDTAPGLQVTEQVHGHPPLDRLLVTVPRFELAGSHDLVEQAEVFGLRAALDNQRGHFPGLSPYPLAVSSAAQDVRAAFSEDGFEAAAVTAIAMQAGAMPSIIDRPFKQIEVRFEEPFGFVAVHRPSGLAVVAGRVVPQD